MINRIKNLLYPKDKFDKEQLVLFYSILFAVTFLEIASASMSIAIYKCFTNNEYITMFNIIAIIAGIFMLVILTCRAVKNMIE